MWQSTGFFRSSCEFPIASWHYSDATGDRVDWEVGRGAEPRHSAIVARRIPCLISSVAGGIMGKFSQFEPAGSGCDDRCIRPERESGAGQDGADRDGAPGIEAGDSVFRGPCRAGYRLGLHQSDSGLRGGELRAVRDERPVGAVGFPAPGGGIDRRSLCHEYESGSVARQSSDQFQGGRQCVLERGFRYL